MAAAIQASICAKCTQAIKAGIAFVNYGNSTFHSFCFTCFVCDRPLAGKVFSKHEGNNVCKECFAKNFAKRCSGCGNLIEGNIKFVSYGNDFYHNECFTCASCGQSLAGEQFYIVDDKNVCLKCNN